MPDICDMILDEHGIFRRRFAELDEKRGEGAGADVLGRLWNPLAALLDRHASAEEDLFYPGLLRWGAHGEEETDDAVRDHNKIRDAVRDANKSDVGSASWWAAVDRAREENSDHMAEEERGPLADFRAHTDAAARHALGDRFVAFSAEHAGGRAISGDDTDLDDYIDAHTDRQPTDGTA
ncbi:MAG: hemerythrin domain-containing protein [Acidimicrobiales bacterium]